MNIDIGILVLIVENPVIDKQLGAKAVLRSNIGLAAEWMIELENTEVIITQTGQEVGTKLMGM